jgi:molybdopterin converting factor small subunit
VERCSGVSQAKPRPPAVLREMGLEGGTDAADPFVNGGSRRDSSVYFPYDLRSLGASESLGASGRDEIGDVHGASMIQVELYGVPRLRAGTARMTVEGGCVGEALEALARDCPALAGSVIESDGSGIGAGYRLSLNGDRFVTDPATPLSDGDTLLLLAADVGG